MHLPIQELQNTWRAMYGRGSIYDRALFRGIDDAFAEADRRVGAAQVFYDFGMGTPNRALRAIRDEIVDQKGTRVEPDEADKLVDNINNLIDQHPDWEMGPKEWQQRGTQNDESARKLEDAFHGMLVLNPDVARRMGAPLPGDGCQPKTLFLLVFIVATASRAINLVAGK